MTQLSGLLKEKVERFLNGQKNYLLTVNLLKAPHKNLRYIQPGNRRGVSNCFLKQAQKTLTVLSKQPAKHSMKAHGPK